MKVVASELFEAQLEEIADYIAEDSPARALGFAQELEAKFGLLCDQPYAFRRSIYGDRDDQRDLIFKGYTVVFLVDRKKDQILLLQIFGQNLPETF